MSIDKKINYEDQRLTEKQKKKIKPANQGGGPNYLGKQETVTVPKKWLSDPNHVVAELAYITPKEKKILLEKNLYGSLKGKPNRGPGGVQSLQGDLGGYDASPGGPDSESGDGSGGRNDKARAADIMTGRVSVTSPSGMQTEGYRGYGPNQRQYDGIGDFYGNPTIGQRIGNFMNPRSILSGILGLINPALGLGFRAFNYLKDEIPETFNQFKDSATLEEFRDKVRGYGRTMPTISPNPMYGGIESLAVNPQTVSVNPQITRDLFAFKPGSVKDRALKQQYGIYNETGMMNPNMIDLMKQDIELNKQKGTPLSLPAEAYDLIV